METRQDSISIVVPTLNEAENVAALIQRIDATLCQNRIGYEVIFIDDRSSDSTRDVLESLSAAYPVSAYLKQGAPGKAQSLLEGVEHARYDTICIIDADLQYPPEKIPDLLQRINAGSDIVVANRTQRATSRLRKVASDAYKLAFAKLLHGFDVDVQSGLKMFRKHIFQRIDIQPSAWAFDLEFLIQARDAGYSIDGVDVAFGERTRGTTKVNIARVSIELAQSAIRHKFHPARAFSLLPAELKSEGYGFHYKGKKFVTHTRLDTRQSALEQLSAGQSYTLVALLALFTAALLLNAYWVVTIVLAVLTLLYIVDLLFNLYLIGSSLAKPSEIVIGDQVLAQAAERVWPSYSIFCPLYQEWEVLPQFVAAISKLDYPPERLQVMLLLEANDPETISVARGMDLPPNFEIVVVPHSLPKTKPKACNYGLLKATGEYVVIYDAEDIPDPQQLKKAVLAFEQAGDEVKCIQAKLNFYNPEQNVLTRLFTAEYSCWFDLILPGLQSIGAPIPLGGTSNHFRLADLVALDGWDAFNVTEDCDLGIRLAKRGYRTAIVDSTTYEEANSDAVNWFWQRSRWIKGYIQSYLVHMRNPAEFLQGPNKLHLLTFQLVVGGKVLSLFVNPLMWLLTFVYFIARPTFGAAIESLFSPPVLYLGMFSLIFGNFLYLYYYMIGCTRREYYQLVKYIFLVPVYWLAMSVAAWVAVYKLVRQPHQWSKTKHGLHLKPASGVAAPALTVNQLVPALEVELAREVNG